MTLHLSVSILQTNEGSEVLSAFLRYCNVRTPVNRWHSDNGREYANQGFSEYCSTNRIIHTFIALYNPQSNGIAERMNRTLMGKVRSTLIEAKRSPKFCGEALNHAVYLQNMLQRSAHGYTLLEILEGFNSMWVS